MHHQLANSKTGSPDHYQAFFTEHANTTTFAWILDVSQFKTSETKISDIDIIASHHKVCAAIVLTLGR